MKGFAPIVAVILVAMILVGGIIFIGVQREGPNQNQNSQKKVAAIGCPDDVIFDKETKLPTWVKGQEKRNISGEESDWIHKNCPGFDFSNPRAGIKCPPAQYPNPEYRTDKAFVIDPTNSKVMYIAVEIKGVFKSTDGGKSWKQITSGILAYPIRGDEQKKCYVIAAKMVIDPTNTKRLLMSHLEDAGLATAIFSETGGLWETTNGGESWHQLIHGEMNASGNSALSLDPKNSQTIYFGSNNYYTENDFNPKDKLYNSKGILFKTTDNGKNWEELPTGVLPWLGATNFHIDSKNSEHLILFGAVLPREQNKAAVTTFYPMESFDGGNTWQSWQDRMPKKCTSVTDGIVSSNFKQVYINGSNCGNLVSQDGGKTFVGIGDKASVANFDPYDETGKHLIGYSPWASGSSGRNILESRDEGITWSKLGEIPKEVDNQKVHMSNIVWDPKNPNIIYMNGGYANLWKSEDGGKSWNKILSLDQLPD